MSLFARHALSALAAHRRAPALPHLTAPPSAPVAGDRLQGRHSHLRAPRRRRFAARSRARRVGESAAAHTAGPHAHAREALHGSLELFQYLNKLGRKHGIGRVDIVENRYVGIKSRGVYETPGGTILRVAHIDIEGIAMDREVRRLRDMLTPKFSELIYNGYWFSPERDFIMAAVKQSQQVIDGTVRLRLCRGNVTVVGRSSDSSLYDRDLSSMDITGGFNPSDSEGFIKINAIRLKAHHAILAKKGLFPS